MNKTCYIGIDPAFRESGFTICIIDESKEVDFKIFCSFLSFLDWIVAAPENCIVCIENSNLQNATFNMNGNKAQVARHSRDVGKNQAASQYTVDACVKFFGAENVIELSPKQKGAKIKVDGIVLGLAKQYGHRFLKKKLNQDERDAYKLAYLAIDISKK